MDVSLAARVERFNEGVRSGNFASMLAAFASNAELVFVGVPVGPFVGADAIAAAYAAQPPDDTVTLLGASRHEGGRDGGRGVCVGRGRSPRRPDAGGNR